MRLSVIARGRVKRSVPQLVQLACFVALVGLAVFAASIVYPKPLVVIFSMSIGHVIGMLAGALYVLAIVLDTVRPPGASESQGVSADDDRNPGERKDSSGDADELSSKR